MDRHKFGLGQILATPGAVKAIEHSGDSAGVFLDRHARGDWGDVPPDDHAANNASLIDGSRILSAYKTSTGVKLWIITEAADEVG